MNPKLTKALWVLGGLLLLVLLALWWGDPAPELEPKEKIVPAKEPTTPPPDVTKPKAAELDPQALEDLVTALRGMRSKPEELNASVLRYRASRGVVPEGMEADRLYELAQSFLSDPQSLVRAAGINLLTSIRGEAIGKQIAETVRSDPDPRVRSAALQSAAFRRGQFGEEEAGRLGEAIRRAMRNDGEPTVRATAVHLLPRGEQEALVKAMGRERDPAVRSALILKLGASGGQAATDMAWKLIASGDEDERVRVRAIQTIGFDDGVTRTLIDRLAAQLKTERSAAVKKALSERIKWLREGGPKGKETVR